MEKKMETNYDLGFYGSYIGVIWEYGKEHGKYSLGFEV